MRNIKWWLENAHNPIEADEIKYLGKIDDLMPLVSKERAPLKRLFDRFDLFYYMSWLVDKKVRHMLSAKLQSIDQPEQKNARLYTSTDFERETAVYENSSLFQNLTTTSILLLGLCLLIGPLWWLQYLALHHTDPGAGLQVISGFLVLFTALLSAVTTANSFEIVAVTAAYGVILVVFLQLGQHAGSMKAWMEIALSCLNVDRMIIKIKSIEIGMCTMLFGLLELNTWRSDPSA